jgi:hypothetical protein
LNNIKTGEEESYWPEMWSLEDTLKKKKRQAPIAFSFQYMRNQIVRQNELSLAPELILLKQKSQRSSIRLASVLTYLLAPKKRMITPS